MDLSRVPTTPARTMRVVRWLLPASLSLAGIFYTLAITIGIGRHAAVSLPALGGFAMFGLIGPLALFLATDRVWRAMVTQEQLQQRMLRQREHLLALNEISESVNRSLDLDKVLNQALERVLAVLQLEAGDIRLIDDGHLTLRAARRVSDAFLAAEGVVPVGQCLCGQAAQQGRLFAAEDLGRLPGLAGSACACEGFGAVLSVPVQTSERVVGLIHTASREPRTFDPAECELLTAIGHQVGVAVERAQFHDRLVALNRDLEARVAQRTLELDAAREALAQKAGALHQILIEERRVEERTRARIAHDLHDGVQQFIVGALFELQAARDALAVRPAITIDRLAAAQALLRRTESEMRDAIYSLRPVTLDAHGLVPALRECVATFERSAHIRCRLLVEGAPARLAPDTEAATFRIVQEALNNAETHARAHQVRMNVNFQPTQIVLEIDDDGVGFDVAAVTKQPRSHLGLIGMRERAESVGGTLDLASAPGVGTRLTLRIPRPAGS